MRVRLAVVREGRALVKIPDPREALAPHGLEPAWLPVFYNPVMEFNRDVSVVVVNTYIDKLAPHKPVVGVEPLAATGVRAVRYVIEGRGVARIHANDIDPIAYSLILENAALNGVTDSITAYRMDARELLYKIKYDIGDPVLLVDIDPYGSPVPFLEAALSLVGHRGLLALTATDLAVLEGSKPRPARRKYYARLVKTPQSKEVAVRTLIGRTALAAASLDKAVSPLVAFYADHYVRVFLVVERGARKADAMLSENMGYALYCEATGFMALSRELGDGALECPEDPIVLGPLWVGSTLDAGFIGEVLAVIDEYSYMGTFDRVKKLFTILRDEAGIQGNVFQRIDVIASKLKVNPPRVDSIVARLKELGYKASRTHYAGTGIRTNASYDVISELIKRYG